MDNPLGTCPECGQSAISCQHSGNSSKPLDAVQKFSEAMTGKKSEGFKQRPEDQPLPTKNEHMDIQSRVITDIEERRDLGIRRYGTALQPNNGRDALQDAYEEAIDLCMYIKQLIIERELNENQ